MFSRLHLSLTVPASDGKIRLFFRDLIFPFALISQAIIEFENRLRGIESLRKITEKLKEDLRKLAKKKYFVAIA